MEIPPEKVFLAQKMMIGVCNAKGKPVVTATQMLESMISAPRPTRAEASDVANAVLDGTDCVMLSGETANGQFPLNAVSIMRNICLQAEGALDYGALSNNIRHNVLAKAGGIMGPQEALASAAVEAATDTGATLIVCLSTSGQTAQVLAKYRPSVPILAVTDNEQTMRQCLYMRGVTPVLVDDFEDEPIQQGFYWAKLYGLAKAGDRAVVVHGEVVEAEEDGSGTGPHKRQGTLAGAAINVIAGLFAKQNFD